MDHNKFFGVRKARGSAHLVIEKPPKPIPPPVSEVPKAVKTRRPRKKSSKKRTPTQGGEVHKRIKSADASPTGFSHQLNVSDEQGIDLAHHRSCNNNDSMMPTVSFFDCEEH